ncbi:DsrE family protein [Fodinibius halophilus]|uniref:DsrE family protein n=1 Tax=Fodinibius halophilus TaxID=1736908 RepID=A0A6M1T4R0_9BACT|nr:DsrE family protein [Fodinibius halophilus]NGP87663.1 DsrE family protein [Fodinibius halophilus]
MKTYNLLLLTLFLLTGTFIPSQAQPSAYENTIAAIQSDKKNNNYALLVRNYNHLKAAVKTVEMMTEDNPNTVNKFEVIICGKKITDIQKHQPLIKRAKQKGITLTACGMSMNKFSMDKEELPKGIGVVPNGLIRIFKLQDDGYKTITL